MPATPDERELLITECRRAFHATMRGMWHSIGPAWHGLDLTMAQLKALIQLRACGPYSVGRLADALGVSEPSTSQLVDRLSQRGLVQREVDATDRRRTVVSLSEEGERLVDGARREREQHVRDRLEALPVADLRALARGLTALAAAAPPADSSPKDQA